MSGTGHSLGFVPSLLREGHSVQTIVGSMAQAIAGIPDIAIMDTWSMGTDVLRQRGIKVFGASSWSNVLDTNTQYKIDLINAIGYKTPSLQGQGAGTRATVVAWFNGQRFISKSLVFNYDKFMSGDVGATVESAGYVAYFNVEGWKIVDDILTPLERFLRKANHRGCISVNTISDSTGMFVTDISTSITLPYTQAIFENTWRHKSDIILDVFDETSKAIPYTDKCVVGVLVSVAPYPFVKPDNVSNVFGLNTNNTKHMWLRDITDATNGKWTSGHIDGCLGYVLAKGVDVWEAKRRVYRTIANIKVQDIQWRNDIGKEVDEKIQQLRKLKLVI